MKSPQTSKEVLFFECLFLFFFGLCFFAVFFFIAESNYNELFNNLTKEHKETSAKQEGDADSQVFFATKEQADPKSGDRR